MCCHQIHKYYSNLSRRFNIRRGNRIEASSGLLQSVPKFDIFILSNYNNALSLISFFNDSINQLSEIINNNTGNIKVYLGVVISWIFSMKEIYLYLSDPLKDQKPLEAILEMLCELMALVRNVELLKCYKDLILGILCIAEQIKGIKIRRKLCLDMILWSYKEHSYCTFICLILSCVSTYSLVICRQEETKKIEIASTIQSVLRIILGCSKNEMKIEHMKICLEMLKKCITASVLCENDNFDGLEYVLNTGINNLDMSGDFIHVISALELRLKNWRIGLDEYNLRIFECLEHFFSESSGSLSILIGICG